MFALQWFVSIAYSGRGMQIQGQTWPTSLCKGWVGPLRQSLAKKCEYAKGCILMDEES